MRGFTLLEVVVALAIGLMLLGTLYTFFLTQKKAYNVQEQVAEMQQNARAAMDMMVNELRMAGFDPFNTPSLGRIVTAASGQIRFTQNITRTNPPYDPDEDVDDPDEDVTYFLRTAADGTSELVRTARSRTSVSSASGFQTVAVAENIESLTFTYLTEDGTPAAALDEISQIVISLTARTDEPDPDYINPQQGDHYRRFTLSATVIPRNLAMGD